MRRWALATMIAAVVALTARVGVAQICTVPSAVHPDVEAAVADLTCTEIDIAAGTFVTSVTIARDLAVRGAGSGSTSILGRVEVTAGTVHLEGLELAAVDALEVHSGAVVTGFDLVAVAEERLPVSIFADGFESADLTGWSSWSIQ